MENRFIFFFTFVILFSPAWAQVQIDVTYKKKKHPAFKFKIARPVAMRFVHGDQTYDVSSVSKDLRKWEIMGNGYMARTTFNSDPAKGIWWEIASVDETTTVLLSEDPTDTNDPREFVITSTADRGKYMVINDEPDCNSIFSLIEPADSPTLLTGVMRTYGAISNDNPCDKGQWRINLKNEPPEHVLIGFVFSTIQSLNVRFIE